MLRSNDASFWAQHVIHWEYSRDTVTIGDGAENAAVEQPDTNSSSRIFRLVGQYFVKITLAEVWFYMG